MHRRHLFATRYITLSTDEKIKTQTEVHRLVTNRDPKYANFIEVRRRVSDIPLSLTLSRLRRAR